jgi:tRNA pseudouridine38-40 synthase
LARFLIELSYKGTPYNGWQIQLNTNNTIQRVVNEKISVLLQEEIMVTAAGRTDAGVHAQQNFAHFNSKKEIPPDFVHRLNFMLPNDIAAKKIFEVPESFNARFDALKRTYEYIIAYGKSALEYDLMCYYPYEKLDTKKLNEVASFLKMQTDFSAFSKRKTQVKTNLCKIFEAEWNFDGKKNEHHFVISADRFLRGMVRGIVGTSIRFARGKLSVDGLKKIIESKQPHKTDFSAPAQGLRLMKVEYASGVFQKEISPENIKARRI